LGGHPEVSEAGMRARGKVEIEDLLVFIPISLWEGANPSHRLRDAGHGRRWAGGESPTVRCTIGRCILLWCP